MVHTEPNVTVATAGSAGALSASHKPAAWVLVQALGTNAGTVYVGDSTVTNSSGSRRGIALPPFSSFLFPPVSVPTPYDLQVIFVNADTGGDSVSVTRGVR